MAFGLWGEMHVRGSSVANLKKIGSTSQRYFSHPINLTDITLTLIVLYNRQAIRLNWCLTSNFTPSIYYTRGAGLNRLFIYINLSRCHLSSHFRYITMCTRTILKPNGTAMASPIHGRVPAGPSGGACGTPGDRQRQGSSTTQKPPEHLQTPPPPRAADRCCQPAMDDDDAE